MLRYKPPVIGGVGMAAYGSRMRYKPPVIGGVGTKPINQWFYVTIVLQMFNTFVIDKRQTIVYTYINSKR